MFGCRRPLPSARLTKSFVKERTFSSTRIASLIIGMRIAFAMKPGESLETTTSGGQSSRALSPARLPFLHAIPNAFARSTTSTEVCRAGITSTSFLFVRCTRSPCSHDRDRVEEVYAAGQRRDHARSVPY